MSHFYSVYSIFYQITAALFSRIGFFLKTQVKNPKLLTTSSVCLVNLYGISS